MVVTLYSMAASPACRSVLLTAKALDVELNVINVNLMGGEHLKPEYVKLNPQHTVPTLVDGDLVIAESRAMMEYLPDAYGKDDSLFPKDVKLRAQVSAKLFFDATNLYLKAQAAYLSPLFTGGERDEKHFKNLDAALDIFNNMIGEKSLYLVADRLTIADITCAVTISNIVACGHDLSNFPNVARWFENCKKIIPGYQDINQPGCDMLASFHKQKFGGQQ